MIMSIFERLSAALYASPGLAMGAAFLWGVLSVLLSPCHIASIPLIVGYVSGQKDPGTLKALKLSTFFTIGILIMMAIIGVITGLMGKILGDVGTWTEPVMGVIFLFVAFFIADILKMPSFISGGMQNKAGKG
ncbi:MAG: cytochrome c biogenesis protein CcdA, partial [Candidatus Cloacimonadaceae bacterium]|nr:cytochrome c biogenesis protein CcdA [Candidatus Cloacimonadaceae bacterium]